MTIHNWSSKKTLLFKPFQIFFLEALAFLEVVESTLARLNSLTLVLKVVIKKAMVICCQNQTKSLMNVGPGKNILFCLMKRSLYILADGMLNYSSSFLRRTRNFDEISKLIWRLLTKWQINWEISSNFCGLLRKPDL